MKDVSSRSKGTGQTIEQTGLAGLVLVMNRRSRMPKRGNVARQDSAQGFAFHKDVKDNIGLMLDKQSEGGVSGKLRRYQWSGKTSAGGNSPSQPPLADVYDAKKMRRGGVGLWRRKRRKQNPKDVTPQTKAMSGAEYHLALSGDKAEHLPLYGDTGKKRGGMYRRGKKKQAQGLSANWPPGRGGDTRVSIPLNKKGMTMYRRRRKSRKHAKRKGRQPMPGGGMPQGFGQGAQYGAPPMSMLGNLGGTGGM